MNVRELIVQLQQFDPELPVAFEDWNEQYAIPAEVFDLAIQNGERAGKTGTIRNKEPFIFLLYHVISQKEK